MDRLTGPAGEAVAHGLDTLNLRGITCSVSVTSWPSLDSLQWQWGQDAGTDTTTRSRGRWAGKRARTGLRRVGGGLHLLELEFELVQQLVATLGQGAEPPMPHLGDHQLELGDDRLDTGGLLLGSTPGRLLGQQGVSQDGDVV